VSQLSSSAIALRVVSGWGISATVLEGWLTQLPSRFDIQVVEIPDLNELRLLSATERTEAMLAGQPQGAYWLGWSLGGALVLDLAAQRPDAVRGAITLATNPCFVGQPEWPGMDRAVFENFLKAYQDTPAKTLQRFAALQVDGAHNPRAQLRELKTHLLAPSAVLADLLELLALDRRELLKNLKVPVLSLLATSDALVPAVAGQKLAALNKELRVELICGASHLLFQDKPEVLLEAIVNWVGQQELSYAR